MFTRKCGIGRLLRVLNLLNRMHVRRIYHTRLHPTKGAKELCTVSVTAESVVYRSGGQGETFVILEIPGTGEVLCLLFARV